MINANNVINTYTVLQPSSFKKNLGCYNPLLKKISYQDFKRVLRYNFIWLDI
jgi:hypothetical protein